MKTFYTIFIAAFLFCAVIPSTRAELEVSIDFFHDNLEPYGDWREIDDYGYCWQPRDVDSDWRPYSDGRWVYTDAGWTWDSDEPYSWAVYHYGRWARVDEVGWVWVPGREWGPAWVSWRRGPRHVGWAPLPPEARFERTSGFGVSVDINFDIGPANYNFVEVRNFGAPRLRTVFIEPRENITIINQTTNITNITYVNNVVYNQGPQYDVISRESAQPIRRLKLDRRSQVDGGIRSLRGEQLNSKVDGDTLRVVAPTVDTTPANAPKKLGAKVDRKAVNRGWKNAGAPEEVEKVRNKIKNEPVAATPQVPATDLDDKKKKQPGVLSPEMNEKRVREKQAKDGNHNGQEAPAVSAPAITEVPSTPDRQIQKDAAENAGKKGKKQKEAVAAKQEPVNSTPSTAEVKEGQPEQPKKGGKKRKEAPQEAANVSPAQEERRRDVRPNSSEIKKEASPQPSETPARERAPRQKAKIDNAEAPRKEVPEARDNEKQKNRPDRQDTPPKTEQRNARNLDRDAPQMQAEPSATRKPGPQQQSAPVVKQQKSAQPDKPKGKGKKKSGEQDEETAQ